MIRAHDWSSTPLGAIDTWSTALRTAVSLLLGSAQPVLIVWGPHLTSLYNDGYLPILGDKHPKSLGAPSAQLWSEIWDEFSPIIETTLKGETQHFVDRPIRLRGRSKSPIRYFTFSCTPLRDESGTVAGIYCVALETTDHVLSKKRRDAERDRYSRMLQQMPGFAAVLNGPEHRFEYVNDAYRSLAGDRDYIGRTVREAFPEIANQGFYQLLDKVYLTGETFAARAIPVQLDLTDGDRFVDLIYEPIRDDRGEVSGIFAGGYDATEQVRAAEQLARSQTELRMALKAGRFGAWSLDLVTEEMTSSEFCRTNFGRSADEPFSYAELRAAIHPDDSERMAEAVERSVRTGDDYDIEYRIITPRGETRWVQVRGQPSYREDGTPLRMSGVSIDVTERHEADLALQDTVERLQLATENAEIGFWDVDPINDVLIWPARTKAMFGISPDSPVTMRDFYDGLHPEDRAATSAAYAAASDPSQRTLYDVEYRTVGKEDGIVRWVAAKGRGVFDETGRCVRVAGTAIDITPRKDAEERLRELNETLEARVIERTAELELAHEQLRQVQKLEAMGSLTGGVAHDFNNLLTPIVGALDILQRKGLGGERDQRLIVGAAQSADRAKTLVQRLLAFARRQPLQAVAVDLGELVRNMADLVSSTTGPQIKVVVDVADNLPRAKADPNQLEMALLNLSVNARDAMPDGGTLRISAVAVTREALTQENLRPGRYLCLSVADSGSGMDDATLARAVEPFFSTKGVGKGTGLGLSMVHGLALQLGGKLVIKSKPGLGTNVELWLPQTADAPASPVAMPDAGPLLRRGTALLVDDEESVRLTTAAMLAEFGYRVIEADSAEEALHFLHVGAGVDLVVTDHLMPGMSGSDLARVIQDLRADLPVLIISGYADFDGIAPDLPRLTKPFVRAELAAALATLTLASDR